MDNVHCTMYTYVVSKHLYSTSPYMVFIGGPNMSYFYTFQTWIIAWLDDVGLGNKMDY